MNVFVVATIGAIFLISVTTYNSLPFKEFIPGYSSSKLKEITVLALKSDSLTIALKKNDAYIQSIQKYSMES
jgi:hypothetical protein